VVGAQSIHEHHQDVREPGALLIAAAARHDKASRREGEQKQG
jgi:hypothetical protein